MMMSFTPGQSSQQEPGATSEPLGRSASSGKSSLLRFPVLLAILVTGGLLTSWAVTRADGKLREDLLQQARLVARAVDLEHFRALTGTEVDLGTPDYLRLKGQLAHVKQSHDKCRFIYLMGRLPDGRVFFFVDNEPVGSRDESPAGQIYEEISVEDLLAFETRNERVSGPATDRWGTWVTALVPLIDPQNGELAAVLGMDVAAETWKRDVATLAAWPLLLVMLLAAVAALVRIALRTGRLNRRLANANAVQTLRTHQQAALAEFGQLALSGLSLDELFGKAAATSSKVLGTEYAKILEHRLEEGVLFLRAGVGWKEGWVGRESVPDGASSQGGYTLLESKPVVVEDIQNETRFSPPHLLTEHNAISGMTVAIPGVKHPFGVLGVHSERTQRFTEDDAHFLEAVANVLAAAIRQGQAEEELLRFRTAIDNSSEHVFVTDRSEMRFVDVNRTACEVLGYTRDELLTMGPHEIEPLQTRESLARELNKVATAASGAGAIETIHRCKDGTDIPVEVTIRAFESAGKVLIVATARDITDRKQAEEALAESERKFIDIFYNSVDATLLIDDGVFVDCNERAVKMLRASGKTDVLNTHPSELSPETQPDGRSSLEKADEMIAAAFEKGSNRFTWEHCRLDGEVFPAEVTLMPVPLFRKQMLYCMWQDITERTRIEELARASEERIELALNGADLGLWDWNVQTGNVVFNERWAEMLGYSLDEIEPHLRSWEKLVHPDDMPHVLEVLKAHLDGTTTSYEVQMRNADKIRGMEVDSRSGASVPTGPERQSHTCDRNAPGHHREKASRGELASGPRIRCQRGLQVACDDRRHGRGYSRRGCRRLHHRG